MKTNMLIGLLLCACSTYAVAQTQTEDLNINQNNSVNMKENINDNGFVSSDSHVFSDSVEIKNYLVISGIAEHFSPAPDMIKKWNQRNYGISYQRSFKEKDSLYRYSLEGGFFKESFGKTATYFAAGMLRDLTTYPRISVGAMAGLAYRVNTVSDGYYLYHPYGPIVPNHKPVPVYSPKEFTPMAGLLAQIEIPHTPAVVQFTFLPKVAGDASAVLFTQLLVSF